MVIEELACDYLSQLMSLPVSKTRYTLSVEGDMELNRDLSTTLRGALGWALREVACLGECDQLRRSRDQQERACGVRGCPYAGAFLGEGLPTHQLRVFPQGYRICAPHHLTPMSYFDGDSLTFTLTLFGRASRQGPYWTQACQRAVRRGLGKRRQRFTLTSAIDLYTGEPLYERRQPGPPREASAHPLSAWCPQPPEGWQRLELRCLTPVLLRELPETPPLELWSRAIMRRLHALYHRFAGQLDHPLSADEMKGLSQASVRGTLGWRDQHRYSATSRGAVPQSGHVGQLFYSDLSAPQWASALLSAGVHIGVGQQTNMGLGRYELTYHA